MMRPRSTTALALVAVLAVSTAACGSDDDTDASTDGDVEADAGVDDAQDESGGDDGGDSDVDGAAPAGSIVMSGAVDDQLTEGVDGVAFRAGGGCSNGALTLSVKIDGDGRTVYDVIVAQLEGIDGSSTGEFATPVELQYFDPAADDFTAEVFTGDGTLTIVDQDADARAFVYGIDGQLTSEDDGSRTVEVDFDYTAPIICG